MTDTAGPVSRLTLDTERPSVRVPLVSCGPETGWNGLQESIAGLALLQSLSFKGKE